MSQMLTQARVSISQAAIKREKGGFKDILTKVSDNCANLRYVELICLRQHGSGRPLTPS